MAERDLLVAALTEEVLGPRRGAWESLGRDEDPLDEYITGVLAPREATSAETDSEDEVLGEDETVADDQSDPGDPVAPLGLTVPALDPRSRPASLGLSFSVRTDDRPTIHVCCTWARYELEDDVWHRSPRIAVWDAVDCSDATGPLSSSADPDVQLFIRARLQSDGWRISLFLVNATPCGPDEIPRTPQHLFQPQIRVRCGEGVVLRPVDDLGEARDDEDAALAFLYRRHRSMARGHLCSAVWSELDPERPWHGAEAPRRAPFAWVDGDALLSPDDAGRFSPADVRTEYVPIVSVPSPARAWAGEGEEPELDPEVLSELWDGQELHAALAPLLAGYATWIEHRKNEARELAANEREIAEAGLCICTAALGRMTAGIELLRDNDDARLAFCFANRAIALQARWSRGRSNRWFPFQLAFQLLNIAAVADPAHEDRGACDLLWFPTGGGKTEAYLGLAAFALGHRRLRGRRGDARVAGGGTTVLSRYTLRLLTIQQFRRALAVVTAAELLRISETNGMRGWRPSACRDRDSNLWGEARFSIGLWVGGSVTPNGLQDIEYRDRFQRLQRIPGAISLLEGRYTHESEPAQVQRCPACSTMLALPPKLDVGQSVTLDLLFGDVTASTCPTAAELSTGTFAVVEAQLINERKPEYRTLRMRFEPQTDAAPPAVDSWVHDHVRPRLGGDAWLVAARGSRPGYLIRLAPWGQRVVRERPVDFEIYCPNPECELNTSVIWSEEIPTGLWSVPEPFRTEHGDSARCPIPALTVDEQVYHRCPSMVIATVDKFARLAFEQRAASLFGNVDRYNEHLGYYRSWCPPASPSGLPARALQDAPAGSNVSVAEFEAPELVLQDELHLIEGPLGSMVGLYETAIETLSTRLENGRTRRPKYVASTATVRRAGDQVRSLFVRELHVFPPPGTEAGDTFFSRLEEAHPLDAAPPGRLHIGICAPGRGAQTPTVRIWSRLLQHAEDRRVSDADEVELDRFWTPVGYFNAIRELASAVALFRQDIVQRLSTIAPAPRQPDEADPLELSSRADSLALPGMLDQLAIALPSSQVPVNAVVATSMFGTGVDVDRLGLMVVHGQPKTTSSYIQASGRVGRSGGGVVVTFYRASRPRDLNHYEFFVAYHAALYRHVEPVTVSPFSPRARDRGLGPVAVSILRQAAEIVSDGGGAVAVDERWRMQQRLSAAATWASRAWEMATARGDAEVVALPAIFERRAQRQPSLRRPLLSETAAHAASELDRWQQLAARVRDRLLYHESSLRNPPSHPVVLGDLAHTIQGTGEAYEDAPNSLREVEATTTFRGWR
jgi:Lhr-like helicase